MRLIDADELDYALGASDEDIYCHYTLEEAPTIDAIPIQYILTTIRQWNHDGYTESAEALEILVTNWDKEKTEWTEKEKE